MPPLFVGVLALSLIQMKDSVPPPPPPPRTIPELEARIRSVLTRTHTPGVGIALVTRDSVLWVAGIGKADVARGRDATAETLFRIGSTSKAFVALMMLLEEQQGKLRLDGTRVAYCNSGPPVAAYIVEKVEGKPFETLVHDRLFVPIGMTSATYFRPEPRDQPATLYHSDGKTSYPYSYIIERPAGAIKASARDMAAYVRFLLNRGAVRGTQVVPRAAIERMELPQSSLTARAPLSPLARAWTGWYVADNPRVQDFYFIERLLALAQVRVNDSALVFHQLFGEATTYFPVTATLFRARADPVPTLALVNDSLDGRPQAIEQMGYLLPRSYVRTATPVVWLELATACAFLLASIGTVLFALVWIPRRFLGRLRGAPHLWVRGWPLIAASSLLMAVGLFLVSADDAITRFGAPTVWSVGFFLCTLCFPVASVAGFVLVRRVPPVELSRAVRIYALVASGLNVIASAYLAWWGMLGWRSWG
jgi:hypothetical protein